jgi:two-component system response regulator HydG
MWNSILLEKSKILIVDDDEGTREILGVFLSQRGHEVELKSCPVEALELLKEASESGTPRCDLVICDLMMPKMSGIELVEKISELPIKPPVILLTGHASVTTAVEGMGKGAFDYITKPVNFDELGIVSDRALRVKRLEEGYRSMKKQLLSSWEFDDIVGKSAQMQKVFNLIDRISKTSCSVLITGESGTGKDMVARAIHTRSARGKKPFVAINCAAIPDTLLESELFGHAKGAFTGATERRRGLIDEANGGTLFLDEIGDMPLSLQAKLLRFLQDRKVKAVGENTYRSVDVRVISATHSNLRDSVKQKTFREDLYFRLRVIPVEIAPLRSRKDDIIPLAEHFLSKAGEKFGTVPKGFTRAALAKMTRLSWPGNVRELQNSIDRALVLCEGPLIDEGDIEASESTSEALPPLPQQTFSGLKNLRELEQEYIEYVLAQTGNKRERAAEILGINRKTLYRKQRKQGGLDPQGSIHS